MTTKADTHKQMIDELAHVLDLKWRGDVPHFDRFAKLYLTSEGRKIAESIGPTENEAYIRERASAAIRA